MNMQYPAGEKQTDYMIEKAIELLSTEKAKLGKSDFDYYAWPEVFSSTAGPSSGMGGCVMTTFTVHAFEAFDGRTVLFCGKEHKVIDKLRKFKW